MAKAPITRPGGIVWCAPGRYAATLQQFFDLRLRRRAVRRQTPLRLARAVRTTAVVLLLARDGERVGDHLGLEQN
jgi:hypothetical protein